MHTTDLIASGVDAYRSGDLALAARQFGRALKQEPRNADALHLLGLIAHRMGHPAEALDLMTRATRADRRHAAAWANRALPLAALDQLDEAERSLRRALKLRRDFPEATLQVARIELQSGRLTDAIDRLTTAQREHPQRLDLAQLRVRALNMAGDSELAATASREALQHHPHDGVLWGALGQALLDSGKSKEAAEAWREASEHAPELAAPAAAALRRAGHLQAAFTLLNAALLVQPSPALFLERGQLQLDLGDRLAAEQDWLEAAAGELPLAYQNLAVLCLQRAAPEEGLAHITAALELDPQSADLWTTFTDLLSTMDDPGAQADRWLAEAWKRDDLDHQRIERATRHAVERGESGDITAHPLFSSWLSRALVRGPDWERRLLALRRDALHNSAPLPVLSAIAMQSWWTEHAWSIDASEAERLDLLRQSISATLADGAVPDPTEVATFAMYAPLSNLPELRAVLPLPGLEALTEAQVTHPEQEHELAASLDVIAMSSDDISLAVRAQYEERPYPRLVGLQRKPPVALASLVRQLLPHVDQVPQPAHRLQVLVAGCGTGQQAIAAASRYADSDVLAVDLSRASIAVAKRRATELGIDNLRFAQADILALGVLDQRFQVVECGGVLHHLADPLQGWKVITELTEPGGLQKIGLYSELGRQDVVAARALVAEWGLPPTEPGLREARSRLLDLPADHPARGVVWSPDFPSLSGVRDLIFHEMEHRFTIPKLQASFTALGLEFLGFQHPMPQVAQWYAAAFPSDLHQLNLDNWLALEEQHPKAFAGMYQFWVRRR